MSYGHFSDNGREFIITRPDTPRPWMNCITNGNYSALVSQTGGGYSFIGGPGYDRIIRGSPDLTTSDRPGRYIFVKDHDSGEYFSIGWQPIRRDPDWFECVHTQGMTTVASSNIGITGRITYFIPMDDNLEIWRVQLENNRDTPADISIFTYVEWVLGNYADDLEQRQMSNAFNEAGFRDNYIAATKRSWRRPDTASMTLRETKAAGGPKFLPETLSSAQAWGKWAFIALSVPVDGYDCDRKAFLGRYGDLSRPEVVVKGQCTNSDGDGRDTVGVLQSRFVIPPGEQVRFDVFLGAVLHRDDPSGVVARYGEPRIVDEKLEAVNRYWNAYLSKVTVDTPDPDLNRAVNIWDKYRSWVSTRSSGLATPARDGMSFINFREFCYDILGMLPMDKEAAKLRTVQIIQHQYRDGSTVHQWELRSDVGARTGHLDDPLWLIFAITSYLKESGDLDFLNDRIKYYYSQSPASVYDHLVKAVDYSISQIGSRGLSLLGPGDWNDTLDEADEDGGGASVLTSQMLCWALGEAAAVATMQDDRTRAKAWMSRAREISSKINDIAWEGEWYIRAFDDRSERIGGIGSGKVFAAPQIWAVISNIGTNDRAAASMNSLHDRLDTPYGPAVLLPTYDKPDKYIGGMSRFAPGVRDNGGVSTLTVAWAIIAECILGHGARAFELFRRSIYSVRAEDQERYAAEPYAHAEYVNGPASSDPGQGSFTWPPGIASWMWRACIDWICGVRPDYAGLRIDPCIPPEWREFSVIRPFRDAVYRVTIHNPQGVEKGVHRITVDGKKVKPNYPLPDFQDMNVHEVSVEMGNEGQTR